VTGNPIVPFHIEAASFWTVNSWDSHQVPKPGSTLAVAIGKPIDVAAQADEAAIELGRVASRAFAWRAGVAGQDAAWT
jgi:lysophospholipid acyltransferase (LPLAT)-like uncharacterized protein